MGQEIVHCSACGNRLRSVDFDKGDAVRIDYTAFCRACAPQKPAPDSTRKRRDKSTGRIPVVTPRRGMEAASAPALPPALLWGGAALLLAILAAAGLAVRPRPHAALPAETVERPAAPPAMEAPKPETTRRAPAPAAGTTEAADLAAIDRKIAEAVAASRIGEALDLLASEKNRHDSLEWTAEIQRRARELEPKPAAPERPSDPGPAPAAAAAAPVMPTPAPASPVAAAVEKSGLLPFSAGVMKWTPLAPKRMTALSGAPLTLLEDGSILAGGPIPAQERYSLVFPADLKGVTALRLEALPDKSLPGSGPGRAGNGNLVLSEFKVQLLADPGADAGAPVAIDKTSCDSCQDGFPPSGACDGKSDTGWALYPVLGRAHEAVFEFKTPLASAAAVLVVLVHDSRWEQHVLGRFRISATTTKNASQEFSMRPPPVIDAARVDQAIQRGVTWLRTPPYPGDYYWSANELILWTFLHAGVPESDPDFQKRLKQMLADPLERTYRVALQAMILEELDRVAYQPRIWQCAQFLVDNQCLNGQWLYGTPVEFPKVLPTASKPVATGAKLDPDGRRLKPKLVRKLVVKKSRDGPAEGDNSNSQYAALGLRACFDAGILIPEETIHRAIKWWRESQYFDEGKEGEYAAKGWSYTSAAKEARASTTMSVGGVSSLTIYDYLLGRDWKKSAAIKSGLSWTAQFFSVSSNYYYLYGLERAGVLYGTEKFGRHTWYPLGAQWILDHQDPSGGWITNPSEKPDEYVWNTWNTCFAILFLKHATRPLVASEDRIK